MDPTREPDRSPATMTDEALLAYLRHRAPGLATEPFDPRAVTARARRVLHRRRRLRTSIVAAASTAAAYIALALVTPLPVPGLGTISVPGGGTLRGIVGGFVPGQPPGPGEWDDDVDRMEQRLIPVIERLGVSLYIPERGCLVLEYTRGNYRDGEPDCQDLVPFDATARADFDAVTDAVERSGVAVERIYRDINGIHIRLDDYSWQYNYEYAYLPHVDTPPPTRFPGERWTLIHGDWWHFRAHDD
jgi:hypothetical protein